MVLAKPNYGSGTLKQWANLFEITNLKELSLEYRLLEVQGLPPGEQYDKNINRLLKTVAYDIKQPVALARKGGCDFLAIPADSRLPQRDQQLMPHVATLLPSETTYPLEMARLDATTRPIAEAFLRFTLRTPIMRSQDLWEVGRACYEKQPLNISETGANTDIYPGFVWDVVSTEDGRLFLSLDATMRYVDHLWAPERMNGQSWTSYRARHFLYHYGHNWYMVQLWSVTGRSISDQKFIPEGQNGATDVFTWTKEKCRANPPAWISTLDPNGRAILYRYPGSEKERYGALSLCKLALSTADAEASGLHRRAILNPTPRFERIEDVAATYFQLARLGRHRIEVSTTPLEVPRRVFAVPPQRFGHNRIVAVEPDTLTKATDVVALDGLGRRRSAMLSDPQAGPLDISPFDAQYIFIPQSSPRAINEDFERKYIQAMREVSCQDTYTARRILYDDRNATSLNRQIQALERAISENAIDRGYALLILPSRANRNLHNYVKRQLWPNIQFQCAKAGKIESFYQSQDGQTSFRPIQRQAGKFAAYVRNCALGMMVVNRKWAWALDAPLHYDVYVGIDVLNRVAGFTFVYNRGKNIIFRDRPCKQKERLTGAELKTVLIQYLREDLTALGVRPESIVIHRDGRTYASELAGLHAAVRDLTQDGLLPPDVGIGVVEIHKSAAHNLRLVEGQHVKTAQNPTVGSYYTWNSREGIVCTTGWPFRFPGTAKPLPATIVEGQLRIERVLEDIFYLSQLVFTAPDKCERLPLTIKISHDFLEPIAGDSDEEEALYGEDLSEASEGWVEIRQMPRVAAVSNA